MSTLGLESVVSFLMSALSHLAEEEDNTGLSLTGQARSSFIFSYSLEIGEVRVRDYEREAGRSRVVPQPHSP